MFGSVPKLAHPRVVDALVDHGGPVPFDTLAARVVGPRTRYLVLDLDRTVHLGLNMGELLGFELCAHQAYGESGVDRLEARRRNRFAFDWAHPVDLAHYVSIGLRAWAYPGLYYLLWGKMASRIDWLRKMSFRRFGAHPIRTVQRVPQFALLRQIEGTDPDLARRAAKRVWDRHAGRQAITRAHLERVRDLAPDVEIVLSSASPQPTVEVAAEALGVDLVGYSTMDRINSGEAKIEHLIALRPDFLQAETVGMSDTGYREDHCWSQVFRKVVDINSSTPFGVVVDAQSPLREVHSAQVLTRDELARRAAGEPDYLDPARRPRRPGPCRELLGAELEARVEALVSEMERLLAAQAEQAHRTEYGLVRLEERARQAAEELFAAASARSEA